MLFKMAKDATQWNGQGRPECKNEKSHKRRSIRLECKLKHHHLNIQKKKNNRSIERDLKVQSDTPHIIQSIKEVKL